MTARTTRTTTSAERIVRAVRTSPLLHPFTYSDAPIIRQVPTLIGTAVATLLTTVIPASAVTDIPVFASGAVVIVLATLWAVVVGRRPHLAHLASLVPVLDFVGLALMRTASGGTVSIVSSLAILPVVWLAMEAGRRNVVYAAAGGLVVVMAPIVATGLYRDSPGELLRGFFVAFVYAVAAMAINEVARRARALLAISVRRDEQRGAELARGGAAQQGLLPGNTARLGPFEVAGVCLPARAVGGDFYDWYPTPDGYAMTLGDVMGKGVAAGIIAATTRAVVRSARGDADPLVGAQRADECLTTELGEMNPFATLFHARLTDSGSATYVDAGHGLTLIRRASTWERLRSHGLPLGLGLGADWTRQTVQLDAGDWLVCFSDGLLDLYGGDDAAIEAIAAHVVRAEHPAELIDALIASAPGFDQEDDVTVVALRHQRTATAR